jgi:ABC-2 type transport system permease protein
MKVIAYLAWESLKMLARQRGQVAFMIVVPACVFFTYMSIFAHGKPDDVAAFLGPVLVLLATTHGMYGVGMDLLVMRETGSLLPYQLTPVTPMQILLSRLVVNCACGLFLAAIDIVLALAIYGMPLKTAPAGLVALVLLGNLALGTVGMLLFSIVNGMDEANFLAQLIFFLLFILSGITAPLSSLPGAARIVSAFLPTTAMVKTFQGVLTRGDPLSHYWPELLVVVAFIVSCMLVAINLFRWSAEHKATRRDRRVALAALLPLLIAGMWFNTR